MKTFFDNLVDLLNYLFLNNVTEHEFRILTSFLQCGLRSCSAKFQVATIYGLFLPNKRNVLTQLRLNQNP